ncbi:MAG: hypothetical protein JO283_19815 [Bradyrhizobium sp.]|nr:hypothetical protein [Bradyrhizobium sp.]
MSILDGVVVRDVLAAERSGVIDAQSEARQRPTSSKVMIECLADIAWFYSLPKGERHQWRTFIVAIDYIRYGYIMTL